MTTKIRLTKKHLFVALYCSAPFLAVILAMFFFNIRFNLTSSMPIGLYIKSPNATIRLGDTVAACLPESIASAAIGRGYLSNGTCAGGAEPVVKQVIALPGETVTVTQFGIKVGKRFYLAPHARADHNHWPPLSWVTLNKPFKLTGFMLYGKHNPTDSWDSRYFGSVAKTNILGVYQPLFDKLAPRHLL